ncbi:MAG: U32 family peptidase [Clostridia bacterium]|nr:U32 family peptidase [Clostridia bacterium]
MNKPELLAPAGDLEKLQAAVLYGADAVYLGGKNFGLRAAAGNFTPEEMVRGVEFAHSRGRKIYVTVNIFAHNSDLVELPGYLQELAGLGVDAVIVADPGVVAVARETVPELPVHLSTQANTTNWASARFWAAQGVERIVLARELSMEEIKEVRAKVDVELECFVHGAMCISYSGRCLLSNYMTGRDANRGECAQACRWRYNLVEEKRPGQYFPIEEDERGSYIFNSQDMSMIEYIPQLCEAGISSFKIEGRMKSVHYVATIVKVYRQAIDAYLADPAGYAFNPKWKSEIAKVSHRDYITGFYFPEKAGQREDYTTTNYQRSYDFVGIVREYDPETGAALVEQRLKFAVGDELELAGPKGDEFDQVVDAMWNEAGEPMEAAPHPLQLVRFKVGQPVEPFTLVRRMRR